jgi:hypothetical protein
MGYNARNDEIHETLERMRREREAYEDALAIVTQFNARLSAKKTAWFWPSCARVEVALNDVRCPRRNGHGRTRWVRLILS